MLPAHPAGMDHLHTSYRCSLQLQTVAFEGAARLRLLLQAGLG